MKKNESIEINGVIYTPVCQEHNDDFLCQECPFLYKHNKGKCSLPDNCPDCWVEKHPCNENEIIEAFNKPMLHNLLGCNDIWMT